MLDANQIHDLDAIATRIPGWPQESQRIALGRVAPDTALARRLELTPPSPASVGGDLPKVST